LPGIRGFSESAIKRMREFYEQWAVVFVNRPLLMGDLALVQNLENEGKNTSLALTVSTVDSGEAVDLSLLMHHICVFSAHSFPADDFFRVGFTHHSEILAKEKSLEGRLFYISRCASEFWTVDTLKSYLRADSYAKSGALPNNFLQTLPEPEQANRAIRAFKDEYLLDFINIEDEIDPDERLFERKIIANIKQFILSFGNKFCFIGNQYRVVVDEKEFFIDLLFFNRELHCLVAVELKRGEFKPSYLGQLNFYLSALDDFVRQSDEAPSIGIILCKEANRSIVEFAVRDYTKPMGVATYRTRNEMPEQWQKALPDFDDMKKLLDSVADVQESESDE
jgi:predicted nuclease of restriction endonuclease-like (RecB) superfamily